MSLFKLENVTSMDISVVTTDSSQVDYAIYVDQRVGSDQSVTKGVEILGWMVIAISFMIASLIWLAVRYINNYEKSSGQKAIDDVEKQLAQENVVSNGLEHARR